MNEILPSALKQIINFLEKLEKENFINYYLVGGILVNIYSVFRITQDIDFVVDLISNEMNIESYILQLQKFEFSPLQDWKTTISLAKQSKIIQFFDKQDVVKFDNYIIDKIDRNKYKRIGPIALKRRLREKLFNIECWVVSKEDFIISKLVYGGWQDYTDALGCWMRFSETLDVPYMEKVGKNLEIKRELDLLMSGIDDPDDYFKQIKGY
ncbi:hypothetical protein LCGC14_1359550 [marine sediment metagenome]|uniref:Uncharacterized protein n=1 Tax=marine sediment metagenome TaxID=412755 RepID=A0A0F9K939_9ZZZZ